MSQLSLERLADRLMHRPYVLLVLTTMFFLGGVFLALYATAYFLGAKIERERAEWEAHGRPDPVP